MCFVVAFTSQEKFFSSLYREDIHAPVRTTGCVKSAFSFEGWFELCLPKAYTLRKFILRVVMPPTWETVSRSAPESEIAAAS